MGHCKCSLWVIVGMVCGSLQVWCVGHCRCDVWVIVSVVFGSSL